MMRNLVEEKRVGNMTTQKNQEKPAQRDDETESRKRRKQKELQKKEVKDPMENRMGCYH